MDGERSLTTPLEAAEAVRERGFSWFTPDLAATGGDVARLQRYCDDLPPDEYMKDGDDFRFRRFGRMTAPRGRPPVRAPYLSYSEPHNTYVGAGVARRFAELVPGCYRDSALLDLVEFDRSIIDAATGSAGSWAIGIHLVRITSDDGLGEPTPEGVHRDYVDFFAVHLLNRNCAGGETRVYDPNGRVVDRRILTAALESVVADDAAVLHDVTPIHNAFGSMGHRDVLIVDFSRASTDCSRELGGWCRTVGSVGVGVGSVGSSVPGWCC